LQQQQRSNSSSGLLPSSSLNKQQQHHHHQQQQRRHLWFSANKDGSGTPTWVVMMLPRLTILLCLIIVLCYVGMYLSALQLVLRDAKATNRLPVIGYHPILQQQQQQSLANTNLRKEEARPEVANTRIVSERDATKTTTLVLTTSAGMIRIVLRPDWSHASVQHVIHMANYHQIMSGESPPPPHKEEGPPPPMCQPCNLYRAESPGILQGVLAVNPAAIMGSSSSTVHNILTAPIPKGDCPLGYEDVTNECPTWDTDCTCHGPVMTRGMVGWAAGQTGPDFFMNTYHRPATWWGTQHTVWGEIQDTMSWQVIDAIYAAPTYTQDGLIYLKEPLHISLSLEMETNQ
jgi:cyclophilin family peptidyl-prolyl cis-trans isomerase